MATNYPNHIDDTSSLPVVADNVNRVSADVINRLRAAIIAVEGELGVKPSAIYGTVTNRLDGIDSIITSIIEGGGGFTAAGDLSGDFSNQIVIRLQGRPVSSSAPNTNDVLTWNGSAWGPATGSGGAPGGVDTYVQFNDGSILGGDAGLTYNKTTNVLSVGDGLAIGTTPATTGLIRVPYATQTIIGTKDSTAIDRVVISQGGGDQLTFGDIAQALNINGNGVVHSSSTTHAFNVGGVVSATVGSEYVAVGQNAATTGDCLRLGPSVINAGVYNDVITTRINGADAVILRIHDGASFLQFSDPNYYTTIRGYSNTYAANVAGSHDLVVGSTPVLTINATTATIGTVTTIQNGITQGGVTDVIRTLHTPDNTITDGYNWTIHANSVTTVDALITAISDDGTVGASYKRTVTFRELSGVSLIGTLHDNQTDEDAGAWDVTIDDDGFGGGRIRVTGDAVLGVTWYLSARLQHVILTP